VIVRGVELSIRSASRATRPFIQTQERGRPPSCHLRETLDPLFADDVPMLFARD